MPIGVNAWRRSAQQLARLQATRDANGGFIVEKPAGIDGAKLIIPTESQGIPAPDEAARRAMQWFRDIAAAGGSMSDLELAWHVWRPVEGEANPKLPLAATFEALANVASRRHADLNRRAEMEALPAKVVQECRRNLALAEQRLEAERRRYLAPLEAEVARAKALLASAEATLMEAA